jgi:hypothetical protein
MSHVALDQDRGKQIQRLEAGGAGHSTPRIRPIILPR